MVEKDYIGRYSLMKKVHTGMNIIEAMQAIIDAPAADVVEVVRCKGCRYFYNGSMKCCTNHAGVVLTDENGFCHHAKRIKDEGGNA